MEFYRYETYQTASLDHDGEFVKPLFPNPILSLITFRLVKETNCGYWIALGSASGLSSKPFWVSKTSKKRYAYPTKSEALENLKKRTERHMKIIKSKVEYCEAVLVLVQNNMQNETDNSGTP